MIELASSNHQVHMLCANYMISDFVDEMAFVRTFYIR
jgi:hypothetical protein